MGSPPAVIIVVRHGARLDAADPQWHLTSPTPYDPPLTYGGWCQSKVLGARISSILQSRESDEENLNVIPGALGKRGRGKRQHKIVIHTSPFLRCVQTSIGISAGLAQNLKTQTPPTKHGITSHKIRPMHSSPLIRPTIIGSSALSSIPEPLVVLEKNKLSEHHLNIRCTLRIDSFLGEWLTPDYFDNITPPPCSMNMIVAAKADLLRREDYSSLKHNIDPKANQPFPGGWGNPDYSSSTWGSESYKSNEKSSFFNMSSLDAALPSRERVTNRERTSSLIISGSHGNRHRGNAVQFEPPGAHGAHGFYQSPVPSYAISKSNPIPSGFVSHARDACVDVDYQWDSMREPQAWGKGGEYGEEWSSMHKRFRAGLQKLVAWYRKSDGLNKTVNRNRSNSLRIFSPEEEAANENTDLVVILVTHGAGCNALIGALTNQPVLLDVGMASLTMAVLKPTPIPIINESPFEIYDPHLVSSNKSHSLSDIYDVKIIANSEHLRSSTNSTPSSSRAPSVSGLPGSRDPKSNFGSIDITNFNRTRPQKSSSGSVRRTASVTGSGGYVFRPFLQSQVNSQGLWSAPTHCNEVEEDNLILDFGNTHSEDNKPSNNNKKLLSEKENSSFHVDKESLKEVRDSDEGKQGLWSSMKTVKKVEMIRDTGQKRRWTLDDRGNLPGFEKPLS